MAELRDLLGSLRAFAIPMRTKFRGITVREGALIQGPAGWGEFSPFAEYGPRRVGALAGQRDRVGDGPVAGTGPDAVPVNVTVPAVGPGARPRDRRRVGLPDGQGQGGRAGPGGGRGHRPGRRGARRARGLAAGSGSTPTAAGTCPRRPGCSARFDQYSLEYAEQPCATLEELAELRRFIDIPVAADESIRKADDPLRVRAAGAADIVMVKVQPLGGVRAALRVAEACGLPVVVSSAVDSSVGLAAGVALAAALPELPYACGLATMSLLAGDVTAEPLAESGGELPVRRPARRPRRARQVGDRPRAVAAAGGGGRGLPHAALPREPVDRVRDRLRR